MRPEPATRPPRVCPSLVVPIALRSVDGRRMRPSTSHRWRARHCARPARYSGKYRRHPRALDRDSRSQRGSPGSRLEPRPRSDARDQRARSQPAMPRPDGAFDTTDRTMRTTRVVPTLNQQPLPRASRATRSRYRAPSRLACWRIDRRPARDYSACRARPLMVQEEHPRLSQDDHETIARKSRVALQKRGK